MATKRVKQGVIRRMTLPVGGAGALLGLLYLGRAPVMGIVFGLAVGMVVGLIDGILMLALISSTSRSVRNAGSRHVISALGGAIAAVLTSLILFALLPGSASILSGELGSFLIFIALPVLVIAASAWWAALSVMKWVQNHGA